MLKFFIFTTFILATYANVLPRKPRLDGRIAGGTPVDITEIPYQTSMQLDYYDIGSYIPICSGVVLTQRTVLTAAHCSLDTSHTKWIVRAGSNFSEYGGQSRSVPRILIHPDYERATDDYDISMFFLSSSLTIDGIKTAVVPLPAQSQEIEDGEEAVVGGWGMTEYGIPSSFLRKITITTTNQELCLNAYIDINPVTDRMMCAGNFGEGGKYTCNGDSGAPLTVNGVLVGITSWGYGCKRPGFPGVFVRVPYFREWIDAEKI